MVPANDAWFRVGTCVCQHVSFWDRRKTGVIYPLDSYNGKVRAGGQSGQDGGRQPATEPDPLVGL